MRNAHSLALTALLAGLWLSGCSHSGATETTPAEGDAPVALALADVELPPSTVERLRLPVTAVNPQRGPSDAPVTIVVFSDFQCPFCGRATPTLERLQREYGDQVRIVWRNLPLPFHQNAEPAAQVAMEAFEQGGNEAFWRMHDALFADQHALERESLLRLAERQQLDVFAVRAAIDGHEHQAQIDADVELSRRVGARGTPNFFINGRKIVGAQPYEAFKVVVDEELAYARTAFGDGVPSDRFYDALMERALAEAPSPPEPDIAPGRPRRAPDPNAVYRVPVDHSLPQRGPADALVTIVQFSDVQCPFCARVEPTLDELRRQYGDDLRVVWMNNPLPFHRDALPAANFLIEAQTQGGDEAFWRAHDLLFANNRELGQPALERYASQLGLDVSATMRAVETNRYQERIEAEQALARDLGATGTPSFFINGRSLRGAQPIAAFTAMIDAELGRARALVDGGTARADVYAALIRDGHTEPQFVGEDAEPAQPSDADREYTIALPSAAPTRGAEGARVVIQLFSDFQCPFCARVRPTLDQVAETYGDRVQIVWRDYPLPFHQNAHLAAEAAREIFRQLGNEGFWAFHDLLFDNQRSLERPTLERLAQQVGANMDAFRQALDGRTHEAAVDADMEAVRAAGARIGTPTSFINGRLLSGAQPFEAFRAAIDRALAEAAAR